MRIQRVYYWFTALCALIPASVDAQGTLGNGTFQDLDFEAATLLAYPSGQSTTAPGLVFAAQAFPGWTVTLDGVTQIAVPYNSGTLDQAEVVLSGKPNVLDGNYTAILTTGNDSQGRPAVISIQQTGTIPSGANEIVLESGQIALNSVTLSLSVNGLSIPLAFSHSSTFGNYFVGNISAFAGTTATIQFTPTFSGDYLDNISFSSQQVPEPSTVATATIGLATLIFVKRRRSMMRKIIEEN